MDLIEVYQLACRLHTGQVDKSGRPYIEHLSRVFLRVQAAGGDLTQQIASLLHDAIEDGKASAECVFRRIVTADFGIVTAHFGHRDRAFISAHRDRPFRDRDRPFRRS